MVSGNKAYVVCQDTLLYVALNSNQHKLYHVLSRQVTIKRSWYQNIPAIVFKIGRKNIIMKFVL